MYDYSHKLFCVNNWQVLNFTYSVSAVWLWSGERFSACWFSFQCFDAGCLVMGRRPARNSEKENWLNQNSLCVYACMRVCWFSGYWIACSYWFLCCYTFSFYQVWESGRSDLAKPPADQEGGVVAYTTSDQCSYWLSRSSAHSQHYDHWPFVISGHQVLSCKFVLSHLHRTETVQVTPLRRASSIFSLIQMH